MRLMRALLLGAAAGLLGALIALAYLRYRQRQRGIVIAV